MNDSVTPATTARIVCHKELEVGLEIEIGEGSESENGNRRPPDGRGSWSAKCQSTSIPDRNSFNHAEFALRRATRVSSGKFAGQRLQL